MYVLYFQAILPLDSDNSLSILFFLTSFFSTDKGLSHPPSTFDSNSKIL